MKIRNPGSQLTGRQQNPTLKDQLIGDNSCNGTNEALAFDKFQALPKLFIKRKKHEHSTVLSLHHPSLGTNFKDISVTTCTCLEFDLLKSNKPNVLFTAS